MVWALIVAIDRVMIEIHSMREAPLVPLPSWLVCEVRSVPGCFISSSAVLTVTATASVGFLLGGGGAVGQVVDLAKASSCCSLAIVLL